MTACAGAANAAAPSDLIHRVTAELRLGVPFDQFASNLSLQENATGTLHPERAEPRPERAPETVNASRAPGPGNATNASALFAPVQPEPALGNTTRAAPSGAICGSDHVRELSEARGFAFNESATETGCAELSFRLVPPPGVENLLLAFEADRSITRTGVFARTPAPNFIQEIRQRDETGAIIRREAYLSQGQEAIGPQEFQFVLQLPPNATAFEISWYFEDSGADPTQGATTGVAASAPQGNAYGANVTRIEFRIPALRLAHGDIISSNESTREGLIHDRTLIALSTPPRDGLPGTVALTLHLALEANLTAIHAPDGVAIEPDPAWTIMTSSEKILTLAPEVFATHGEGAYGLEFLSVRPAPVPPVTAPVGILPAAIAVLVLPVAPGAAALRSILTYRAAATGRFVAVAKGFLVTFVVLFSAYALLLAYVLGAPRLSAMAFLPLGPEGVILVSVLVALAVAFAVLWLVPTRYAMRSMEIDIEERRRAEARFRALLEGAPDAMVILDARGRVTLANAQVERAFGYPRERVIGEPVEKLLPRLSFGSPESAVAIDPTQRGPRSAVELVGRRADGREFPAEVSFSPIEAEGGRVVAVAIRDITQRKRILVELERSNQELEQFAYVASHDLQEPLRTISGFAQLLERRYAPQLDDKAKSYVHRTVAGTQRMQDLINDLLAYSRAGTQQKPHTRVDLSAEVGAVLTELEGLIASHYAAVTRDPLPTVVADPAQIGQVFSNLIRNAIKYADPARPPRVHIGAKREHSSWTFTVRDNGVGIDPAHHEKIFVIFQRVAPTAGGEGGTGLGLAISKRIVERHGGSIWVESVPGEGSAFHFTLPDPEVRP